MIHWPDCHVVLLDESEFKLMLYYLLHNVETPEDESFCEACMSIIEQWEGGDIE